MEIDAAGLDLIKRFEGCRLTAYQDQVGVWTIGWGTTSAAGLGNIHAGMQISQQQADNWLLIGVMPYEKAVWKSLDHSPSQNQFNAMVSLCYNIGPNNFAGSSLVRDFNSGNIQAASYDFLKWNKAGGVINLGLMNRRKQERAIFLTSDAEIVPIPVNLPFPPMAPFPTNAPTAPPVGQAPWTPQIAKPSPTPQKPASTAPMGLLSAIIAIINLLFKRKATK